jgi:hypothetical protein
MGHGSQLAAMIYLHGSDARQHQISDTLSKLTREELKRGSKRAPGGNRSARNGHETGNGPRDDLRGSRSSAV